MRRWFWGLAASCGAVFLIAWIWWTAAEASAWAEAQAQIERWEADLADEPSPVVIQDGNAWAHGPRAGPRGKVGGVEAWLASNGGELATLLSEDADIAFVEELHRLIANEPCLGGKACDWRAGILVQAGLRRSLRQGIPEPKQGYVRILLTGSLPALVDGRCLASSRIFDGVLEELALAFGRGAPDASFCKVLESDLTKAEAQVQVGWKRSIKRVGAEFCGWAPKAFGWASDSRLQLWRQAFSWKILVAQAVAAVQSWEEHPETLTALPPGSGGKCGTGTFGRPNFLVAGLEATLGELKGRAQLRLTWIRLLRMACQARVDGRVSALEDPRGGTLKIERQVGRWIFRGAGFPGDSPPPRVELPVP